jgi:uncharacterized protein YciI
MSNQYVVFCRDQPASSELRSPALADHLKHIEAMADRISLAAALKSDDGSPSGSIIIVEASCANEARALVESDPFFAAGVWESLEINQLGNAVGKWAN